jgi:hypothetical protein
VNKQLVNVLYVAVMAAVIVGVDFAFLRGRFWARLVVNVGIVVIFVVVYLGFLKRS